MLYELDALHDYPSGALEEENAALKDAMEALKDYVDGKRSDSENISAIINGALKVNAPNDQAQARRTEAWIASETLSGVACSAWLARPV